MSTTPKKRFLPIWVYILMAIELVMITGVTIVGMQDITVMHPDQTGSSYLASLYITRNLVALGGLVLATYVFRSYVAFFLMLLQRIATEVSDFSNSYWFGRDPEVLASIPYLIVLLVVLPTIAMVVVWPDVKQEAAALRAKTNFLRKES
ncbi:hypothetical protein [Ruegeria jejuensis]|uniref:hypothetical protein n=1 Tax=Ruegeria jejuensis TaxID=3233338 RepID=UPI00355BB77F